MEKFKDFWRQYRTPALIGGGILLFLLCAVTGAALWLTRGFWMDAQETAIHATEPVTEAETIAVITEPPTTEPPPASAMIENVPYYSQHGLLPTGCELVSAKMLLEYYTGREVDMQDIIDRVDCQYPQDVDGIPCAPHPSEAFIGSPWDETSFGCFSPIICDMMNNLLPRGYVAVDTTGTELSELAETYIPQGRPVLVWATIAMLQSFPHMGWYLMDEHGKPTDEWYDWLAVTDVRSSKNAMRKWISTAPLSFPFRRTARNQQPMSPSGRQNQQSRRPPISPIRQCRKSK